MTAPPPEQRHSRPANTDARREEADDVHFEVVAAYTRCWGEQGGSYSPDRRYRTADLLDRSEPGSGDREGRCRPTVQRMVDRSLHLSMGMGRFILVNLFSWRTADPGDLRAAAAAGHDIIGSDTDQVIADTARCSAVVVAAWEHHGTLLDRERQVLDTIPDLMCLGLTTNDTHGTRCKTSRRAQNCFQHYRSSSTPTCRCDPS